MRKLLGIFLATVTVAALVPAAEASAACKKPPGSVTVKTLGSVAIYSTEEDWGGDYIACIRPNGRRRTVASSTYTDSGFDTINRLTIKGRSVIVTKSTYNMDITPNPYMDKYRVDLRTGKHFRIYHRPNSCRGACDYEGDLWKDGKWISQLQPLTAKAVGDR